MNPSPKNKRKHLHKGPSGNPMRARKPFSEFQQIVQRMRNWQRQRWARAGYPGLREEEVDKLDPFSALSPNNRARFGL